MKTTPENITELAPNEVFVFGSNLAGRHGAGAAKQALKWGAAYGHGKGMRGQTYAIPTKDEQLSVLRLSYIQDWIENLLVLATIESGKQFLVTKIGCGLAGYSAEQIAELFKQLQPIPENVSLPREFWDHINK